MILESGNRRRTVWFLGGNPVAVVSDDPQDHLSQFLLEHGKISDEIARRIADLPETREALGSTDFLPKETLNWGVKSRFVKLCYDLFRWEDGDFSFHEGDPPRELFLLKVPAHSLIFKGVGLLGQAAVFDAAPDDAVCGAGPVSPADARYLSPEALRLLEQCRPGRTVAEALGGSSADLDQARRLLYALACLGLVTLSRGRDAAIVAAPVLEEGPGFILDEDDVAAAVPAPAPAVPGVDTDLAEFSLNLPPLGAEYDPAIAPGAEFDPASISQPPGGYPFEDESGPGSFGSFDQDALLNHQGMTSAPTDGHPDVPEAASKRSGRGFHLPRIAGIAIGSIAAAGIIGFAGWWWMSGSEPPPPTVKPPLKRPAAVAPVAALPAPVPAPTTQAAVRAPVSTPATSTSPATTAPPIAPAPPAPPIAPKTREAAPRPAGVPSGASGADRYRNGLENFRAGDLDGAAAIWEALLAAEHRGSFTLQLLTACQHDTIKDAQRSLGAQELYLVTKKVNGRVCYRVCIGTFESRESAGRALAGLPGEFRAGGASIRPVADVLERDR